MKGKKGQRGDDQIRTDKQKKSWPLVELSFFLVALCVDFGDNLTGKKSSDSGDLICVRSVYITSAVNGRIYIIL